VKVDTKTSGLIDIDERQKISIPQGLFGFEKFIDYVLLDAEQEPFYWLQSMDDKNTAFILINPVLFRSDFEIKINSDELADLEIKSIDNALVFSIVTIHNNELITANLQGPLVINKETKTGKQAILNDPRWQTRHDIMAELAGSEK
jgi:flagellar assembly factor FliW